MTANHAGIQWAFSEEANSKKKNSGTEKSNKKVFKQQHCFISMKYFVLFLFIALIFPLVSADIGPSPDFSFSIGNASDYPEYKFYYAGNIWPEKLTLVDSTQSIYKLNTNIKIYAVPKELATEKDLSESRFEEVSSQSIISQQISLASGETVFEVTSFDVESKSMVLEVKNNIPDNGGFDLFSIIIPLIVIIVIIVVAVKFLKGKKNE